MLVISDDPPPLKVRYTISCLTNENGERQRHNKGKGISRKWKSLRRREDKTLSKVGSSIQSGQGNGSDRYWGWFLGE